MNLKYFIVFVAGMAALAGCQEASEYIPSIYITEAQRQEVKTITISQAGEKAEFTVSAAQIVDRDTHVSFEACPELVADYNDRYGRTAVALGKCRSCRERGTETGNILLSAGQDRLYGRRHVDLGIVE